MKNSAPEDIDRNLYSRIYEKYKKYLYKIAFDTLKNREDAEDAVHQTFIKLADNFGKISCMSPDELKIHIAVVCRCVSKDIYRGNKRRAEKSAELSEEMAEDMSIFEDFDYKELVRKIKELPDIYGEIIYLRYVNGISTAETAKILDISAENVYKRTERAKKMLLESLRKDGVY